MFNILKVIELYTIRRQHNFNFFCPTHNRYFYTDFNTFIYIVACVTHIQSLLQQVSYLYSQKANIKVFLNLGIQ